MRPEEQLAADLLTKACDGRVEPRDCPGAPSGSYDFDWILPGERKVAVEVTTVTAPELKEYLHALQRKKQAKKPKPRATMGQPWIILRELVEREAKKRG